MKRLFTFSLSAIALLLVSCTSPIVKRIEHNPQIYAALSDQHKSMVSRGEISEGMTKQAVFIAWGRPDRGSKGSQNGKAYERWSYSGYEAVQGTSMGVGMGYWGYGYYEPGFYYAPTVTYLPYEARRVEFLNNKVTAWS
ncbi:MAG: hypothetical protein RL693_2378, partial [Verrucomicrobiota bacterium]